MQRRHGMLIGAVAIGMATVIAGVSPLIWSGDNARLASQSEQEALEMATGFVEAWTSFDADGAAAYLSNNALIEFGGSMEAMRVRARMNEAQGQQWLLDECEVLAASAGTTLRCPYDFHGLGSDLKGLGPFPGQFRIEVSDGEIVVVRDWLLGSEYATGVLQPFAAWVKQTYPSDAPLMWTDARAVNQTDVTLSEVSIELWEQHSREWADVPVRFVTLTYPPADSDNFRIFGGVLPSDEAVPSRPGSGDIVTDFARIHAGWVFLYSDGRVLWSPDTSEIFEIWLTPDGLDLVRSGDLPLESFIRRAPLPATAVEDPRVRLFVPTKYAICYWSDAEQDASQVVDLLPAAAQPLLRGKERTYTQVGVGGGEQPPPNECHELTTDEARQLDEVFEAAGIEPGRITTGGDWNGIWIQFTPLLPHGQWVLWGG